MDPEYTILFQPRCDESGINRLYVSITLESPGTKALETLCRLENCYGNVPTHEFMESSVHALDGSGPLRITFAASASKLTIDWRVARDIVGDVSLQFEVYPRVVDSTTPPGPRVDLRHDQGGLIGSGCWFLPEPVYCRNFKFQVEWDLSLTPANTRAAWSFGEGPRRSTATGPIELLLNSVFMVGPINSSSAGSSNSDDVACVIYWFGHFPNYLQPAADFLEKIFLYSRSVFQDTDSSYKLYIRKCPRGFGGQNFSSSAMLEYSDVNEPKSESEVVSLFTHEMVHNWAYLGSERDGYQNLWFIEGIAHFYALYLPIRAGIMGENYFREVVNGFLCAYYTNPLINTPLRQTNNDFFTDPNAESIPYMRGFLYILLVDATLRRISPHLANDCNPIDHVVMAIINRNREGKLTNSTVWLETLYPLLGKKTTDLQFQAMINGETIELDYLPTFPIAGKLLQLEKINQETIEVGFNRRSGIIEGVVPGSRAELTGLRNGDTLISCSRFSECSSDFKRQFSFVVERGGQRIEGKYWPRSYQKVTSFHTVLIE